jgi:ribosomal RNA-processing protein 9
MTKALLEEL